MAQVTVTIGGRVFRLACNEGEEPHLETLAREVDAKIDGIRASFGEIGDQRLIVMAALTIADELSEAQRTIASLEAHATEAVEAEEAARREADLKTAQLARALGEASHRIESLAAALAQSSKG
jgi:cell division protein ZapA